MVEKVALITGGSRGIGRAIAHELAPDHRVLVGGTDTERVHEVVSALPNAAPFLADLTDAAAVRRAWEESEVQELNVLVHSAGVAWTTPVGEAPLEQWREMFEINVFAVAELTRLALPALRAAAGHVVAINSGAGFRSRSNSALYSGSKFALRAFTDALREEERGKVRVTSLHPGQVDTDMQVALQAAAGNTNYDGARYISPEAVAKSARLAVDNEAASGIDELTIRPINP
ncbi:SDR family oxidoreductase [Nesterenkonia natronophila]|uniref:SDR family oxidoreductase n=1 Tax=Nesterenkonia natronophila TaxID=2174932 RepID=A0A3A4FHT5_9MICC|nr:SDR family oxidoreductase [Nesterenkonia natronophila]RJN31865.1 SDR family oxidoreductase [Nesterenkonia natronophila]